jgi:uncharacterized protein (DUF488 family)
LVATLFTIGHSTRDLEDFFRVLQAHSIESVVDVRAFPLSRRYPHFNRESLERTLMAENIRYLWVKELGGRRRRAPQPSLNLGLRSLSFRNYADHMLTAEFEEGIAVLLGAGEKSRTAYMCAERLYFRCHRMLISDWLVAHGHEVLHVDDSGPTTAHRVTSEAQMIGNLLLYPAP